MAWTLRYRSDGCAAIVNEAGVATWIAGGDDPAVGRLTLKPDGDLVVRNGEEVVWRSGPLARGATELHITDSCDGVLVDMRGLQQYSLRTS